MATWSDVARHAAARNALLAALLNSRGDTVVERFTRAKQRRHLQALAEEIARDLFTNGAGQRAKRLVLLREYEVNVEHSLGGWGEKPMADHIAQLLQKLLSTPPKAEAHGDGEPEAVHPKQTERA